MSNDWDEDSIGYGRPPVWTRFQKGQSGNPKGRPKKQQAVATTLGASGSWLDDAHRAEMNRKILVSDAKGSRELPMLEVIIKSQANAAATGNTHAQREIIRRQWNVEQRDAERRIAAVQAEQKRREEAEQTFANIVEWKKVREQDWRAAISSGEAEPSERWPHPDDILIDAKRKTYHIRGPIDEACVPYYEFLTAERDWLFMQAAKAVRFGGKSWYFRSQFYSLCCDHYDTLLPLDWQIADRKSKLQLGWLIVSLRKFKQVHAACKADADRLRAIFAPDRALSSEQYRLVNSIMAPAFKKLGYRSLAQFERACELNGGEPPRNKAAA